MDVDNEEPLTCVSAGEGLSIVLWQVQGSNLRRLSRLIYSQIPLATRATCRGCCRGNDKQDYRSRLG